MTATTLWWITLGVGLVVVVVVAVLLALIVGSARRIKGTLEAIWVAGPQIAANTAQLDLLRYVNRMAGEIYVDAREIAENASRLHAHAEGCPGCPTMHGSDPRRVR